MDSPTMARLSFLQKASNSLPSKNRAQLLLKSHYLTRKNNLLGSVLSKSNAVAEESTCCAKCLNKWTDMQFTINIKPAQLRCTAAETLVNSKKVANKSQKILANKYRKSVHPKAEVTCSICGTYKRISIRIKSASATKYPVLAKESDANQQLPQTIVDLSSMRLVHPKKRIRDKNAGLTITKAPAAAAAASTKAVSSVVPIASKKINQKNGHPKGIVNKGGAATKKNKKTIQSTSKDSKQRNNILLLANALKMKSNHSATSQLQSMLR